jgi:hypothetical protein
VLHSGCPPVLLTIDYFGGRARFELAPDGRGGTELLLTHDQVAPEEWNEVHAGWLNVLFPLKAWVTHGVDLRNHDGERSWDQGYADQSLGRWPGALPPDCQADPFAPPLH